MLNIIPNAQALQSVGNVTITDGVATGFSATDILKSPVEVDYSKPDYEICCRFLCTNVSGDGNYFGNIIFRALKNESQTLVYGGSTINIYNNQIKLYLTYGSDTTVTEYTINYTPQNNKIYSIKLKRTNGTKYSLLLGTDDELPTKEIWSVANNSDLANGGTYFIGFGGGRDDLQNQYLRGNIYLEGTYMSEGGEIVAGQMIKKDPGEVVIDDGTNQTSANYLILNDKLVWSNPGIYLQSTGTQRIDTGVIRSNLTDTYTYKGSISFANVTTRQCVGSQGFFYFGVVNGHYQIAQGGTDYVSGTTATANKFVDFDIKFQPASSRADYKIDTYSGSVTNTIFQNTPANAHINLFSLNDLVLPASCKISRFKIYRNDVLLRDFIPVPSGMTIGTYTTPSAGMWDIVNQQFYANSGSGTFTWGKD